MAKTPPRRRQTSTRPTNTGTSSATNSADFARRLPPSATAVPRHQEVKAIQERYYKASVAIWIWLMACPDLGNANRALPVVDQMEQFALSLDPDGKREGEE